MPAAGSKRTVGAEGAEAGPAVSGRKAKRKAKVAAAIEAEAAKGADNSKASEEATATERAAVNRLAFDDELDDLAYLRRKAGGDKEPAAEAGKKIKLKKKRRSREAAEGHGGAQGGGAASAKASEAEGEGKAADEAEEEEDSSGRLFVTNFSYGASEDELRTHFESLGEVATVQICKDEDTQKSRGFGYVTYVFPECAVRAQAELDMQSFQGRILRVSNARPKPEASAAVAAAAPVLKGKSSYKKALEARKKKVDAHLQHTWNLLYVSANAAADAAAAQLGVTKGELLGKDAEGAALTAALTETSVIQQTKRWLQKEGIRVEAFEQSGPTLARSRAVGSMAAGAEAAKRRDDTFIVKHLPAGASVQELRERFARHGELLRCSLAPSGTVAIVQYIDQTHAKRAFQKLVFSRYRHVPLYLEWAPEGCFTDGDKPKKQGSVDGSVGDADEDTGTGGGEGAEAEDEEGSRGCLFVKNLNFATTDEAFRSAFSGCRGFRAATIMRKRAALSAAKPEQQRQQLSMGYGFVEFDTPASAMEALKRRQGVIVDDHALQLQISQRGSGAGGRAPKVGQAVDTGPSKAKAVVKTQKLCVRNLAFETTRKELSRLFGAYGSVTAVRMPKKSDYSGHRGFAFVDFASKAEAAAAFEALQHTHLYGRRMVIEAAEETTNDVGAVEQATQKKKAAKELRSEAKRRKKAGVLDAPGAATSFKDGLVS